jgi:hypothetical protein
MNKENLGPAETIISALTSYSDHLVHNRPGIVEPDPSTVTGVRWSPVTHVVRDGKKVVIKLSKVGKKEVRTEIGSMDADGLTVRDASGRSVGRYMAPGVFPEVAVWMYKQVARVWELDNEFAACWASYAHSNENSRDIRTVLCAFMLCQSRKGDPVKDGDKVAFYDEDYRDVGEAMMLLDPRDKKIPVPKLMLRVREVLCVPGVAAINRDLGFGASTRKPFLGRWTRMVERWLSHLDSNPKILERLLNQGYRTTIMSLSQQVGFKPEGGRFFDLMRWRQSQSKDGRRGIAIGAAVREADSASWVGLSEAEVCERIMRERPGYKRLVSLLPREVGLTPAVVSAAVEAGCVSDKDLIILTPTLEELGLLKDGDVKARWERAMRAAEDTRAANVARNVKSKEAREKLVEAADDAAKKVVAKSAKNIRTYFFVDSSGSMDGAIDAARDLVAKFIQAFPPESVHVAHFNSIGREVKIPHASTAGVMKAFEGLRASGGTSHAAGVGVLQKYRPKDDEDVLFIWIGDEADSNVSDFSQAVRVSGLRPNAFGLVKVIGRMGDNGSAVRSTAASLGIPCFPVSAQIFSDAYATDRIRDLIASTPVGVTVATAAPRRTSLVETISQTKLIRKPTWAATAHA